MTRTDCRWNCTNNYGRKKSVQISEAWRLEEAETSYVPLKGKLFMTIFRWIEETDNTTKNKSSTFDKNEIFKILEKYLGKKETGLFPDLAAYSLISENNAAQYYPSYAYSHPLFTKQMHVYSDSKVSDFLAGLTDDQRIGFVNEWNENRDHREKIYISYDSTNKNCQAGDLRFVEFGHPKDDRGLPVFNYSIAYDTYNKEPLFYEQYPGSIVDISQLQYMLKKAEWYGYKRVGFILDRGYFGRENIRYMDECGYDFVIMVKGMSESVRRMILENKGEFENIRKYNIWKYKTFGKWYLWKSR